MDLGQFYNLVPGNIVTVQPMFVMTNKLRNLRDKCEK